MLLLLPHFLAFDYLLCNVKSIPMVETYKYLLAQETARGPWNAISETRSHFGKILLVEPHGRVTFLGHLSVTLVICEKKLNFWWLLWRKNALITWGFTFHPFFFLGAFGLKPGTDSLPEGPSGKTASFKMHERIQSVSYFVQQKK